MEVNVLRSCPDGKSASRLPDRRERDGAAIGDRRHGHGVGSICKRRGKLKTESAVLPKPAAGTLQTTPGALHPTTRERGPAVVRRPAGRTGGGNGSPSWP